MDIIASYKESIRVTQQALNAREKLLNQDFLKYTKEDLIKQGFTEEQARKKMDKELNEKEKEHIEQHDLSKYMTMHGFALSEDVKILRAMLSSMKYALSLMLKDRNVRISQMGKKEIEIAYSPEALQKWFDSGFSTEIVTAEERMKIQEYAEEKQHLINEMTKCLTRKQKQIMQLKASQYTHKQIAEMLKMPTGTVDTLVKRAKEKIASEGWFMI